MNRRCPNGHKQTNKTALVMRHADGVVHTYCLICANEGSDE